VKALLWCNELVLKQHENCRFVSDKKRTNRVCASRRTLQLMSDSLRWYLPLRMESEGAHSKRFGGVLSDHVACRIWLTYDSLPAPKRKCSNKEIGKSGCASGNQSMLTNSLHCDSKTLLRQQSPGESTRCGVSRPAGALLQEGASIAKEPQNCGASGQALRRDLVLKITLVTCLRKKYHQARSKYDANGLIYLPGVDCLWCDGNPCCVF
jgi:hypothetical protein